MPSGVHGPHERAQRSERGQADDRRRRREPEPPPGAGGDSALQRVLHRQQADGLRPERARGVLRARLLHPHTSGTKTGQEERTLQVCTFSLLTPDIGLPPNIKANSVCMCVSLWFIYVVE